MLKSNFTYEDYSTFSRKYQLKIDSDFEKIIPNDDNVRLLDEIVEQLDFRKIYASYSNKGRKQTTNPKTLFKILVYGNMDGKYSSRELSRACQRDINYMWLLGDEKAPNHNEINRFRSERLPYASEELFAQLNKKLEEAQEIKFEHLFVDGTKIEANANKYSFVWKKTTCKLTARLDKKLETYIAEINKRYNTIFTQESSLEEILGNLNKRVTTEFVYGRGKRKTQLQKDIEVLQEYITRQTKYGKYNATFGNRNSFSKTDNDATFMHMKDDHMRNSQLKPGYNLCIGVEGEYITGLNITSERSDSLTLKPLLEKMKQNYGKEYATVTCDAGFESEENYTYFENNKTTCYIKPTNYERSKTKKFKDNMSLRENMAYDSNLDEYTCQNGKKLKAVYEGKKKSASGFESITTFYECESCEGCVYKKACTKAKGNRKMQVSKKFITQRELSLKNITSDLGIQLRINRSIQVEGAFGVLKQDMDFRQFLLRGNRKVLTETILRAFAYNICKFHNKIQAKRTKKQLFEKMIA